MIDDAITVLFVVVAMIHLPPLVGVLSARRLHGLYDVQLSDPNLEILTRHRAVLFGLLAAFLVWAGLDPALQPAGFVAGFASVLSFLALALRVNGYNAALMRVVVADLVALGCLVLALVLWIVRRAG